MKKAGNLLNFNVKQLNRGYYDVLFNQGKTFFASAPYKSAVTGNDVLGITYQLTSDVAILASVDAEHILGNISHRKDMFMYSADGTILISPYPQYLNKNILDVRPLYKQFNKNNSELTYSAVVNNQDTEFSAFWASLDINEWAFVTFKRSEEIAASANISDINTLVATASQEQHAVTEEISQNMTKVFDLVQLNVSALNQTLQASAELSQLAEMQKNELEYCKI